SRTLPSVPMERMRQIQTRLAAPATARSIRPRSASAAGSACATPAQATSASAVAATLLRISRLALLHLGVYLFLALARRQDLFPRPPSEPLETQRVRVPRIDLGLERRGADGESVDVDLRALRLRRH